MNRAVRKIIFKGAIALALCINISFTNSSYLAGEDIAVFIPNGFNTVRVAEEVGFQRVSVESL